MYEKLVDIIVHQLQVNEDDIDEDTDVMADLGADSLDVVEMLMAVEDAFEIDIPDEDVAELTTVGSIASYIENRL